MNFGWDMLNARCQCEIQKETMAGISAPMSGIKRESFNKSAFDESWAKPGWMGSRKALKGSFSRAFFT